MKKTVAFLVLVFCAALFAGNREEMISDALGKIPPALKSIPDSIKRVAVSAIEIPADSGIDLASLQDQIGAMLLDSGRFGLIDRKSLKQLVEEQQLSMTGLVDTGSMVKAGKLIGVQGFFYGSVEVKKDQFTLNLKLVEVESGAIMFSRKFVGMPQSFVCVSAGVGYSPLTISGTNGDVNTPMFGFLLSYKQGFAGLTLGYLGVDILMTKNFSEGKDLKRMELKPKFYFSMKRPFKWEKDYLVPYLGLAFNMLLWDKAKEPSAFSFNPFIGIELNFAKFVSLYAEGVYVTAKPLDSSSSIKAGLGFSAGLKFNVYFY